MGDIITITAGLPAAAAILPNKSMITFIKEVSKFKPKKATIRVFKKLLLEEFSDHARANKGEQKSLHERIEKLNGKLGRARELLLSSELDSKDYKAIKQVIEQQLVGLEAKLVETSRNTQPGVRNVEQMTEKALEILLNLDSIFVGADSETKRQIVGSIFPERLLSQKKDAEPQKSTKSRLLSIRLTVTYIKEKPELTTKIRQSSG
ncbi:hypothetical protein MUK70_14115 [Dyadobacter chenwenxiniae]|uniref:Uncharacterized protein n=1 Tax=Dyadobacter chenwenxiniae TaxID=2906456 RepID=A0A9X1PJ20_9BACT|nr:hypothetical protein [Dyadobacter chenwenxiniae]MCF0060378.1 hypothetical protein [Dyadobacter chenwenxiniae]UON86110.1 hypothetical protein MUK70_14115 [Dyadobacter chenwenxiniae]